MKVKEFVALVNSLDCEEFSDIPESEVDLIKSRVHETWSFDDTYSTSMNVYECEDGYAGVVGVCHLDDKHFDKYPNDLRKLPHCVACEVSVYDRPTFVPNPNDMFTKFMAKISSPI